MRVTKYLKGVVAQQVDESDMLLCVGVASISYGINMIFPPAAYIFTGAVFVALAVLQAKGGN